MPRTIGIRQYPELDDYISWYRAQIVRHKGTEPTAKTLRSHSWYVGRMVTLAAELFRGTESFDLDAAAEVAQDRAKVEHLISVAVARWTSGTARNGFFAFASLADWLEAIQKVPYGASVVRQVAAPAKNPPPDITVYTPQEMRDFVTAARGKSLRWWAFMAYLVETGRRVGETLDLRWDNFRLDADPPHIVIPQAINKSRAFQMVPLTKMLREEVFTPENVLHLRQPTKRQHHRDPTEFPFPWSYQSAQEQFRKFCEQAGFPNRGFHNFRHTVITARLAAGVPIQAVAALAGHSSTATTDRRYNHTNALNYARYLD